MRLITPALAICGLLSSFPSIAETVVQPDSTITALRVDRPPKLDGILDESEWQLAQVGKNFVQMMQNTGAPATEKTEFRVLYTDKALYVGVWCYDSEPDKVTAHSMARDFSIYIDDVVSVILDTYNDKSNSFFFVTNANGALYDSQCEQDGNVTNERWNGVWDCQVTRNDQGFFLEIEIPFSTLRFPDQEEQVWGINIERDIQRRWEVTMWQPVQPNEYVAAASRCGKLLGLSNIERGNDIEVKPYGLIGFTEDHPPYGTRTATLTKAGLNAKIPLSSRMTVDVTLNPDFTQIEDDQAVINITRYPLFLPERREFFLESEANLGFNLSANNAVFYSRRIGLYQGSTVPIIGGVRLVGRTDDYSIGVINMETDKTSSQDYANYSVARIKRNLPNGSYIGMIATNKEQSSQYNRAGGLDASMRFWNAPHTGIYEVGGAAAWSTTQDVSNQENGCYRIYFANVDPNNNAQFSYRRVEKNFIPKMGYVQRYGDAMSTSYTHSWRRQGSWFYSYSVTPLTYTRNWDLDGKRESENYSVSPLRFSFNDLSQIALVLTRSYDRVDYPFMPADSLVVPAGDYWATNGNLNYNTNVTQKYYGSIGIEGGQFFGGDYRQLSTNGGVRIDPHFSLDVTYKWTGLEMNAKSVEIREVSSGMQYDFNTHLQTTLYSQWNSEIKQLGLNYRLHWIPAAGNDVYLGYNIYFDTDGRFRSDEATLLLKASYRTVI